MKPVYFMGIDVGTNETKGVLINSDCKIIEYQTKGHNVDIRSLIFLSRTQSKFGGGTSVP